MNIYKIIRVIAAICVIISCIKMALGIDPGQARLGIAFGILALISCSNE